jgi:CRISPR/Cas system-associated endoribonuclease Cas2
MANEIVDGAGTGNRAKVDSSKRLYTNTIQSSFFEQAVLDGEAYNVNTGLLSITSSAEHSIIYLKNNEDTTLVLDAWFVGTDLSTNGATLGILKAYYNATGGTIISGGTTITTVNRLAGSAKLPKVTALSGGQGFTATGVGTPVLLQTQGAGSRAFGSVKLALESGASIVITYDPNGAETLGIYTGFQFYKSQI